MIGTICSALSDLIAETLDLILLPVFEDPGRYGRPRRGSFKVPDSTIPEGGSKPVGECEMREYHRQLCCRKRQKFAPYAFKAG